MSWIEWFHLHPKKIVFLFLYKWIQCVQFTTESACFWSCLFYFGEKIGTKIAILQRNRKMLPTMAILQRVRIMLPTMEGTFSQCKQVQSKLRRDYITYIGSWPFLWHNIPKHSCFYSMKVNSKIWMQVQLKVNYNYYYISECRDQLSRLLFYWLLWTKIQIWYFKRCIFYYL